MLDTNVVVSGLLWRGPPRSLLDVALRGAVEIYTSVPLLIELRNTLSEPKFDKKIASSMLSLDQLTAMYALLARPVVPAAVPRLVSDSDDDVVIGTAIAAGADFIVTGDKGPACR